MNKYKFKSYLKENNSWPGLKINLYTDNLQHIDWRFDEYYKNMLASNSGFQTSYIAEIAEGENINDELNLSAFLVEINEETDGYKDFNEYERFLVVVEDEFSSPAPYQKTFSTLEEAKKEFTRITGVEDPQSVN